MIQYIAGHTYQIIDFLSCWAAAVPFALQKWGFFSRRGWKGGRFSENWRQRAVASRTGHGRVDGVLLKLLRTLRGIPPLNSGNTLNACECGDWMGKDFMQESI